MSDCTVEKYMPGLSLAEQKQYAQEFSEGDEHLTKLLLFLWEQNIQTIGCCKGHDAKYTGYIAFCCENISQKTLLLLLHNILNTQLTTNKNVSKNVNVHLCNQQAKDMKPIDGYQLGEDNFIQRGKSIGVYMPQDADFEALLKCFTNAFVGEDVILQIDEKIKLALRLMDIDLTKQKFGDILDYIGAVMISINSEKDSHFILEFYQFYCQNFSSKNRVVGATLEEALKSSKYKAIRELGPNGEFFFFLKDGELWDTNYESRLKVFQSLNISKNDIKNCYFDLTEQEVEKFEKQIYN